MDRVTVSKLEIHNEVYFLCLIWNDDIEINLVHKDRIWSGTFDQKQIEYYLTALDVAKDQYLRDMRAALAVTSSDKFIVSFENEELKWTVVDAASGLKCLQGKTRLDNYRSSGGTEFIVEILMEINQSVKEKLHDTEEDYDKISTELQVIIGKFQQSADEKTKMQEDVYARFLEILNAKKQRIAQLEDFISNHAKEPKPVNTDVKPLLKCIKSATLPES